MSKVDWAPVCSAKASLRLIWGKEVELKRTEDLGHCKPWLARRVNINAGHGDDSETDGLIRLHADRPQDVNKPNPAGKNDVYISDVGRFDWRTRRSALVSKPVVTTLLTDRQGAEQLRPTLPEEIKLKLSSTTTNLPAARPTTSTTTTTNNPEAAAQPAQVLQPRGGGVVHGRVDFRDCFYVHLPFESEYQGSEAASTRLRSETLAK